MSFLIHPWTIDAINPIAQLEAALHPDPWPKEAFMTCFNAGYQGFVVTEARHPDHSPIAYVLFTIAHDECHLLNIGVSRLWQRLGIGDLLLAHAEMRARTAGAATIYLEVRESNHVALHLYHKHGFETLGKRKAYYRSAHGREDAILLLKRLKS